MSTQDVAVRNEDRDPQVRTDVFLSLPTSRRRSALCFALITLAIASSVGCRPSEPPGNKRTKVSIGIQVSPAMTLLMVAKDQGFFEKQGLDVELKQFTAGKFALQAFFAGSVDYAVSGEVPVCLAALGGNQARVVSQVVERTIDEVRVVARKDGSSSRPSDPAGFFKGRRRRLATSFGGGPEFFTYKFLEHYKIPSSQVEVLSQRPEDMPASLVSKSVDAVSIFDPFAYIAEKQLGEKGVTFRASEVYSELYVLVAHPKQVDGDVATIESLLRALGEAQAFTAAKPDEAKQILQKYTKLDRSIIDGIWGGFSFKLALTPELLSDWNAEARWAQSTGKVASYTQVPEFRSYIEPRFLKSVDPESVKLH